MFNIKASNLAKWSISTWTFMCWCQIINCLKFQTRPSSLRNLEMAYNHRKNPQRDAIFSLSWQLYIFFISLHTNLPTSFTLKFMLCMASRICRCLQLWSMKTCKEDETASVLKTTNANISFERCKVNQNAVVRTK